MSLNTYRGRPQPLGRRRQGRRHRGIGRREDFPRFRSTWTAGARPTGFSWATGSPFSSSWLWRPTIGWPRPPGPAAVETGGSPGRPGRKETRLNDRF